VVIGTSQRLVRGALTGGVRCQNGFTPPADVERLLLEAAANVLTQLRVLRSLVASAFEARELVVTVHETAESHRIASMGAIGVTGVLADLLCRPCERELAETLVRARAVYTDDELLNGAASMLAATSSLLGERLGLDPAVVVDEVAEHVASASNSWGPARRRNVCRRHVPAG
jgi:hypothetical protein